MSRRNRDDLDSLLRAVKRIDRRWRKVRLAWRTTKGTVRATVRTSKATYRLTRWVHTHRRACGPFLVGFPTLWPVGWALHRDPNGGRAAVMLTLIAGFAVGARIWRRHRAGRRLRPAELLFAGSALAAACGWLYAAALLGVAPPMPGPLLVGTLAWGIPWWNHHRIRPHVEPVVELGPREQTWGERVACTDGALPKSELLDVAGDDERWSATINLPAGKLTTATAVAATERIAGAYGLSVAAVTVEPTVDAREDQARVAVYRRNPLAQVHHWPGPHLFDPETGIAPIGVHHDGEQVLYRFWRSGSGAVHTLLSGTSDAGKSRLLDQLLCYERHSPLICSLVIDPQEGQSLPDWQDDVAWFAPNIDEGVLLLRALREEMYDRNRRLARMRWVDSRGRARRGKKHFDPSPDMPLLSATVDEAHRILAVPEAVEICVEIAPMARKCGIKLRLVTQVPLLSSLGNKMELRDALVGGNVIVLRTGNRLSGQVAFNGNLPVDPVQLPKQWPDKSTTSGLGYVFAASDRAAMMRSFFVRDPYDWATRGALTLPPAGSALARNEAYLTWRERRDAREAALDGAPPAPRHTAATAAPERPAATGTTRERVVAIVTEKGRVRTGVVAELCDISLNNASQTLRRLANEGLVRDVGHGEWASAKADAA